MDIGSCQISYINITAIVDNICPISIFQHTMNFIPCSCHPQFFYFIIFLNLVVLQKIFWCFRFFGLKRNHHHHFFYSLLLKLDLFVQLMQCTHRYFSMKEETKFLHVTLHAPIYFKWKSTYTNFCYFRFLYELYCARCCKSQYLFFSNYHIKRTLPPSWYNFCVHFIG